ncbi:uncharacterized protein LOC123209027 isoform X1 [Mangifera indica]|uniref:uncharacterized protein LOC123209027 isoform X1 n=1 Tax=Mangifera indica TaxID=29780 RepID=UPI001CFAD9EE|nr:uncharacterized protein LOC123209027 isoform X1 [Mangifera indica]
MELVLLLQAPLLWDQFLKLVLFCLLVLMVHFRLLFPHLLVLLLVGCQTVVLPYLALLWSPGLVQSSIADFLLLIKINAFRSIMGTNVGDISLWEVGSVARLAHKSFKVWDKSAASMPLQMALLNDAPISVNRNVWGPDGLMLGPKFM